MQALGGIPRVLDVALDTVEALTARIHEGLAGADMLVTSAGVSRRATTSASTSRKPVSSAPPPSWRLRALRPVRAMARTSAATSPTVRPRNGMASARFGTSARSKL